MHPSSAIDANVEIGSGTRIWHFCHVMSGSVIGRNCIFGQNVFVGQDVHVGNGVKVQNIVSIYKGVTIEDDVFLGPSMVFTNVINPRSEIDRKNELMPTVVRRGASIGANATVLCGVTVGRWAFIGAGAVVTRDVPDYGLTYGNPARMRGWVCQCGEKLSLRAAGGSKHAMCVSCGRSYSQNASGLVALQ